MTPPLSLLLLLVCSLLLHQTEALLAPSSHQFPAFSGLFSSWVGGTLAVVFLLLSGALCCLGLAVCARALTDQNPLLAEGGGGG